ncbi:MAG: hypothetical protein ICV68_06525 [Pyrinomonadaceae bacterium]|nr:hypothetical protein [Pyrinomonadaceae bacterium]
MSFIKSGVYPPTHIFMLIALALTLIATVGGALATYLYDEDASIVARLCAGACTGLAALGLLGFLFASFLGLNPLTLALSAIVLASPLALLRNDGLKATVSADLRGASRNIRRAVSHPSWTTTSYFVFYLLIALLLWLVFERAYFELPEGIYTGVQNNYGDLPFHISVITSFARGANFPPQDPTFAGAHFTYPFIVDFVAAMFVRAGASLRGAMLLENFVLALSLVGLLHRWTLALVRNRLAAAIASVLVLFSGGLGWVKFLREVRASQVGLFNYLVQLAQAYTISGPTLRWGNALTTLLVPQRGILFALPLSLIAFTLFWRMTGSDEDAATSDEDAATGRRGDAVKDKQRAGKKKGKNKFSHGQSATLRTPASTRQSVPAMRRMIAAGVIAGLLPLVHAHTLMVVLLVGGLMAVLRDDWRAWAIGLSALALLTAGFAYLTSSIPPKGGLPLSVKAYAVCAVLALAGASFFWLLRGPRWREWLMFFIVAIAVAAPQLLWAARGSSVQATSFIGWHFGWDHGDESVWRFWLKNTGLFIPLLLVVLVWRWKRPLISERLLFYYLPFTLCFIIPNLVLLAPWVWDNIKVLFYWYLASVPLVALLLAYLWRSGPVPRVVAVALLLVLTLAGALDVWSVVGSEKSKIQVFDRDGVRFAEALEQQTRPRALILHAPTFNHPVFLTGRQPFMGYPGHIWTHGLSYQERETMIKRIYAGGPDAASLLSQAGVEYVVLSPMERQLMPVNAAFFVQYPLVVETAGYRLYKTTR